MSMPSIQSSGATPCQAYADILESIALQEAGLAHIINAEGEKIQTALGINEYGRHVAPPMVRCIGDIIALNNSVSDTLTKVIKLEMVLEFKLEEVGRLSELCKHFPPVPPHCNPRAEDPEFPV